jgi:DNA-binding response OmpR family regulator
MKILTVEDNAVDRAILRRALTQSGHDVVEAANGEEAWTLLQGEPLRLVVSDWEMPFATGLELCRRIRARTEGEYLYFILVTSHDATDENQRLAADAGVDDFLTKPFKPSELWIRLRVAERVLSCTSQIRRLEALLPMCSYCKKIRNDQDYWQQLESYIGQRTGSEFSHSICPDCYKNIALPELKAMAEFHPGD